MTLTAPPTGAPPSTIPALSLRDVTVRYGGTAPTEAVQGLSLTVAKGSFHAILGPSGCGKSTLLKMLGGLLPLSGGDVAGMEGRVSYVPQGDSCFPWMTAEDNVAFGLEAMGIAKGERLAKARALLEDLGLGASAKRYPHQLSEGMRQRVAIARGFAVDADLLLMDEPLSALDFQTKMRVQEELLQLWQRSGATVLYVTHDIDEALTLADSVSVLSPRPATVLQTLDVPFGRPRSYRSVRQQPGYGALFAEIDELLRGAEGV